MSYHPTRRSFLKAAGLSLMTAPFVNCQSNKRQKPNIIYILADDLGYGDLGHYGQTEIQTPELDKMAQEGMRFTSHYAGSTVCAPSRCCLMTGLHTGHARVRGNGRVPLQPADLTVAEMLKQEGYTTGLIGKWGLGEAGSTGIPNKQGFDYFFGYLNQARAHNYYPEFLWRNEEKVQLDNTVIYIDEGYAKGVGSASTGQNDYSHDLFTKDALEFVETHSKEPFFLYLAYTIPHANNEAHILDRHGMEVPEYGIYAQKDWPEAQKGHAAMITRMDADVGKLLENLRRLGLDQNTIVMFTSDNGPHKEGGNDPEFNSSSGPLRGIKRDLYEGGIRVPMIAWWPGKIEPGSTTDLPTAFWDILPTCGELAGAQIPPDIDGLSFAPTLLGQQEQQQKHKVLYWEFHWGNPTRQAIRMGPWKGFRNAPDAPLELYNLEKDISEQNNVADKNTDIVATLEEYMENVRTNDPNWPLKYQKDR